MSLTTILIFDLEKFSFIVFLTILLFSNNVFLALFILKTKHVKLKTLKVAKISAFISMLSSLIIVVISPLKMINIFGIEASYKAIITLLTISIPTLILSIFMLKVKPSRI